MSLNRFRHTNTSSSNKPLFEISLPAAPKPTHSRALYKHSRVKVASPSTSFEDTDDDVIPLTGSSISSHSSKSSTSSSSGDSASASGSLSLPVSRNNSFKMKTLDPRRLSMRLKSSTISTTSRPNSPLSSASRDINADNNSTTFTTNRAHTDPLPFPSSTSSSAGRADFVYKPIRRTDYTTVVAETATTQNPIQNPNRVPLSSASPSRYQYNYISGRAGSSGKERQALGLPLAPRPRDRSRIRARAQAHYALHDDEDDDPYNDLDGGYIPSSSSRGHEYAMPAPVLESSASAAERKRVKAARRLTTVMVPDAEDIYG
ncbi:uncharacterized protein BDV14DRAFT_179075 [Aspergillus stella-maris]|uniref:uncharacterized protein n=1 Tax=Aspergillus stella-maris TaxID=1810926 RepID=UPI003CCDD352